MNSASDSEELLTCAVHTSEKYSKSTRCTHTKSILFGNCNSIFWEHNSVTKQN